MRDPGHTTARDGRDRAPFLRPGDPAPPFAARPVFGLPVVVPDGPIALVFLRHLGSPTTRQALHEMQARWPAFDAAGLRLVAVSRTSLATARDYVPRHHLLFPFVADPEGDLFRSWGAGSDPGFRCTAKGLHRVDWAATARALAGGAGPPDGPIRQLAAAFAIDAAGVVRRAEYACHVFAVPDLEGLFEILSGG